MATTDSKPFPACGVPGGWRDWWDGPDQALLARAAWLEAVERREAAIRRERDRGEDEG